MNTACRDREKFHIFYLQTQVHFAVISEIKDPSRRVIKIYDWPKNIVDIKLYNKFASLKNGKKTQKWKQKYSLKYYSKAVWQMNVFIFQKSMSKNKATMKYRLIWRQRETKMHIRNSNDGQLSQLKNVLNLYSLGILLKTQIRGLCFEVCFMYI